MVIRITAMNVSVAEAKAKFSDLLKRAEGGEEIAVTRHGKVVARLVPPAAEPQEQSSLNGAMAGKIWMAEDFDELGPEWDEYIE
jgi:prevent-host-death family protein